MTKKQRDRMKRDLDLLSGQLTACDSIFRFIDMAWCCPVLSSKSNPPIPKWMKPFVKELEEVGKKLKSLANKAWAYHKKIDEEAKPRKKDLT